MGWDGIAEVRMGMSETRHERAAQEGRKKNNTVSRKEGRRGV
jgi:hypothetical protein